MIPQSSDNRSALFVVGGKPLRVGFRSLVSSLLFPLTSATFVAFLPSPLSRDGPPRHSHTEQDWCSLDIYSNYHSCPISSSTRFLCSSRAVGCAFRIPFARTLAHSLRSRALVTNGNEDSDGVDDSFQPKFDGQLYYGLAANDGGYIETTASELRARVGADLDVGGSSMGSYILSPTHSVDNVDKEVDTCHNELLLQPRERAVIEGVRCISRTITLSVESGGSAALTAENDIMVTVFEMEKPSDLVQNWMMQRVNGDSWEKGREDPFGVVMWPGSIFASKELMKRRRNISGRTVLVLGAGSGVEAQVAAMLGASKVIALDNNPFTLTLLKYGVERAGYGNVVQGMLFDITEHNMSRLPDCDVVVISDLLYNVRLAESVGMRCEEVLGRSPRPTLIVTDSQRFHGTNFLQRLNENRDVNDLLSWKEITLKNVTGSGILIDGDQTYDVKARALTVAGSNDLDLRLE